MEKNWFYVKFHGKSRKVVSNVEFLKNSDLSERFSNQEKIGEIVRVVNDDIVNVEIYELRPDGTTQSYYKEAKELKNRLQNYKPPPSRGGM